VGEKRFQFIEHTADVGVVASGQDMAEAFANAAYGLFSIITEPDGLRKTESREVSLDGPDLEGLLFEWLNHLIYLFEVEGLLFKKFDITHLDEQELRATCYGEKYDPSRHQLKVGVKAATYHMLRINKERNQVQVIFDI